jgi:signal transduction histidine kinase
LWNLGLLGAAALSLAVATAIAAQALPARVAVVGLVLLIVADLAVVLAFGRHLVEKLVLGPVERLMQAADAVAAGDLAARAPAAETEEFHRLSERLNGMTEALLDAQSQLVRAEKLAGIGRLAAGVAHEVGNPLAAIGTYLEVLRQRGGVGAELVVDVEREVERIDEIVRGLLTYARADSGEGGPVDPAAVTRGVVELLTTQGVLKNCDVRLEVDGNVPIVWGTAGRLEQVLVNLVLNAVHAAPRGPIVVGARGGAFGPGTGAVRRRSDPAHQPAVARASASRRPRRSDLSAGTWGALLYVADGGPGVPESERDRVFDPFYTTKSPGAGTGLGLAIVQRLVDEMRGLVWVERAREGGAAFKIFLPAQQPDRPDRPPPHRPAQPPERWVGEGSQ